MIKADKWRVVSDDDITLKSAYKKIFAHEIEKGKLHYFVNTLDKSLSREDAYKEFIESKQYLKDWAESIGMRKTSDYEIAVEF